MVGGREKGKDGQHPVGEGLAWVVKSGSDVWGNGVTGNFTITGYVGNGGLQSLLQRQSNPSHQKLLKSLFPTSSPITAPNNAISQGY